MFLEMRRGGGTIPTIETKMEIHSFSGTKVLRMRRNTHTHTHIMGNDPDTVQASLDLMTRDFRSIGLKMNAVKTEYMIMTGGKRVVQLGLSTGCKRAQALT